MNPDEYILKVKEKYGAQPTRTGMLVRDMNDKVLLKQMLERYPSDATNIVGLDEYLGADQPKLPPPTETESFLSGVAKSVVRPFARLGLNVQSALDQAKNIGNIGNQEAFDAEQARIDQANKDGTELPWLGNTKPVGQSGNFGRDVADAVGVGTEVAATVVPVGPAATTIKAGFGGLLKQAVKEGAAIGAGTGGAMGVGQELQDPDATVGSVVTEGLKGTAIGTVGGAVLGPAVGVVTHGASAANDLVRGTASKARSWMQPNLKPSVETVLKETPSEVFENYVTLATNAVKNNKNQTPMEYAGTRAQEALDQVTRKLSTIGRNKSAILETAAGRKPVGSIVVKFRQGLQNALKSKTSVEGDTKLYKDIMAEAENLGNNPNAAQVDRFVDFVQDKIYTAKRDLTLPVTDDVQRVLRPLTGQLNDALKANLPAGYKTLNQRFAELVGVRNELNEKLGKEGEKGGALMKRIFSPSDANTKQLFADILDETGIDLVNEATLAKFTMDMLGDARQKSMLEQLNLSATKPTAGSISTRILDYVVDKVNSPEATIQKARGLTLPKGNGAATPSALPPKIAPTGGQQPPVAPVSESSSDATTLFDKAKALLKDIKTKGQQGFIKNPFVEKLPNIHPDDLQLMEDFIDHVRIKKDFTDEQFAQIEKLAEKFDINMDKGLAGVANKFVEVLEGTLKVPSTVVQPRGTDGKFAPVK